MDFFKTKINSWQDWVAVLQDGAAFTPLIQQIYASENETFGSLAPQQQGSNAVFICGQTLIKIFPPEAANAEAVVDYQTERFGLNRAQRLDIPAPKLLHAGIEYDSAKFRYLILQPVIGEPLNQSSITDAATKQLMGNQLGKIMTTFNEPIAKFNQRQVFQQAERPWKGYSDQFEKARLQAVHSHQYGELVAVHGDLIPDNLLLSHDSLAVIDFADALLAPAEYELGPVVLGTTHFDADWLTGLTQQIGHQELLQRTLAGLLLHQFGGQLIRDYLPALDPATLTLDQLTTTIQEKLNAAGVH